MITKYYYDGDSLLYTADQYNNKAEENILDPSGTIVASKRFDGSYNNMYFFYNYDIRGSVTNIIGPDGSLIKGYSYDEFGKTKETGDSQFKNDVKFTGAVHDLSPDLYYMNSRFYNPNTGRFLSQDSYSGNPYEPWTQHLYNYSANNPINYIDPTGHAMMAVDGGGIGYYSNRSSNDSRNNGYTAPAAKDKKIINSSPATRYIQSQTQEAKNEKFSKKDVIELGGAALGFGAVLLAPWALPAAANYFMNKGVAAEGAAEAPQKVIGHYPEYVEMSNKLGVKPFSIPDAAWNKMTTAEQWAANQKFLDRAIAKGSEFNLATPIDKVRPGSYLVKEIQYLISKGYKLSSDGTKFIK